MRHISKYGAVSYSPVTLNGEQVLTMGQNRIKNQAHDHPKFRALAARYGQSIHQLNMKLSIALLRDFDAERRAKERAEAPTVKTEEQTKRDDDAKAKSKPKQSKSSESTKSTSTSFASVWRRKFRPLPEAKAVDLFADVIGDTFILGVATGIILYEYWKSSQKPDANKERLEELKWKLETLTVKEDELAKREEQQRQRFETLEEALRALKDPKTKQPLLPTLQTT